MSLKSSNNFLPNSDVALDINVLQQGDKSSNVIKQFDFDYDFTRKCRKCLLDGICHVFC